MDRDGDIHDFTDEYGQTRYAVCRWDEAHGQWTAPLDAETRRLTGCYAEFARTLQGIGGYATYAEAERKAHELY
jgi:hypothetical protein